MSIAGLPAKEYCKPTGIPIIIILIIGLIGIFLAYDAAASVNNYLNTQDMLYWFGMVQFAVLLFAGALAGYLISAKSNLHLAGAVAGASALIVGTIIVQLGTFAVVIPRLKEIAVGLVNAGVSGADALATFGTSEMLIALLLNIVFAFIIGIVVGLIGQIIGNSRRK